VLAETQHHRGHEQHICEHDRRHNADGDGVGPVVLGAPRTGRFPVETFQQERVELAHGHVHATLYKVFAVDVLDRWIVGSVKRAGQN
jgi:hypothetical protein